MRAWLDGIENLQQVGRNGLHRYNNSDHSMLTAMRAVDNLLAGAHHDIWEVNAESVYHETDVVEEHPYRTAPETPEMQALAASTLSSHRRSPPARRRSRPLSCSSPSPLQSVWWTPLNVDEELTLRLAQFSFRNIFHIVSTQRGGGPLHFWLEHFLQGWWPGLEALRRALARLPCLALPAVALIARELVGDEGGAAVVLLLARSRRSRCCTRRSAGRTRCSSRG